MSGARSGRASRWPLRAAPWWTPARKRRLLPTAPPTLSAAPTIREVVSGTDTGSSVTITAGAGTQVGDTLVVVAAANFYSLANLDTPPTGTAGTWTQQTAGADAGASEASLRMWTREVTVGGAQTITIGHAQSDPVLMAVAYVLEGAASVQAAAVATGIVEAAHTAPTATAATAGTLRISAWTSRGAGNYTVPGSMTEDAEPASGSGASGGHLGAAHEDLTVSGNAGTRTATQAADTWDAYAAATIILVSDEEPPTPQTGSGHGGFSATGTAAKTAIPSGSGTVGSSAYGTVTALRYTGGTAAVGASSTGTAAKFASTSGTSPIVLADTGTAAKTAVPSGTAVVGTAATGTATTGIVIAQSGTAHAGVTATGTAVKTAVTSGTTAAGAVASGTAAKVASVGGACSIGAAGHGAAVKTARPSGASAVGGSDSATAVKRAAPAGTACTGQSATGTASKRAGQDGATTTGTTTTGSAAKTAVPAGTSAVGAVGTAVRTARDVTGTCYLGTGLWHRRHTWRPTTGATARPDTGTTAWPATGTTTRPGSGTTTRPDLGTTPRP